MTTRLFQYLVLSVAVTLLATSAPASFAPLPLETMVKNAALIVIGEVVKHEKTTLTTGFMGAKEFPVYKATVVVGEVIKGDPGMKEVEVFHTLHAEDGQFRFGNRVVYFLATNPKLPGTLQVLGIFGEVVIRDNSVKPLFDRRERSLNEFIQEIKTILAKNK